MKLHFSLVIASPEGAKQSQKWRLLPRHKCKLRPPRNAAKKSALCNDSLTINSLLVKLLVFLCACALLSYRAEADSESKKNTVTITDVCGYEVKIPFPARRLVVTNSDAAEVLCALGAGDRIIGVTAHTARMCSDLFSQLKGKAIIGSWQNPSLEKIIELEPDVVITYDMWRPSQKEFAEQLAPFGISVVRAPCYRIDRLAEDIKILGKIVGKEEKAQEYIEYYQEILAQVQSRLKGIKKKVRVYGESYGDYVAASKGSGAYELLKRAGVDNIAGNQPISSPRMAPEWVVDKNPEVIIKVASSGWVRMGCGALDREAISNFRNRLVARPVWDRIEAVKNGRVYIISAEIWTDPRAAIGILYAAKWCYPELFKDIDPEAIHRKWLMKWHRKELKGIYVYPNEPRQQSVAR